MEMYKVLQQQGIYLGMAGPPYLCKYGDWLNVVILFVQKWPFLLSSLWSNGFSGPCHRNPMHYNRYQFVFVTCSLSPAMNHLFAAVFVQSFGLMLLSSYVQHIQMLTDRPGKVTFRSELFLLLFFLLHFVIFLFFLPCIILNSIAHPQTKDGHYVVSLSIYSSRNRKNNASFYISLHFKAI